MPARRKIFTGVRDVSKKRIYAGDYVLIRPPQDIFLNYLFGRVEGNENNWFINHNPKALTFLSTVLNYYPVQKLTYDEIIYILLDREKSHAK